MKPVFADSRRIDSPGETIFEYAISKFDLDTSNGIGIALAQVREAPLHHHNRTYEIYFCLSGGAVEVDGVSYRFEKNDLIYIPIGAKHRALKLHQNSPRPAELLVISSPPFSLDDYFLD